MCDPVTMTVTMVALNVASGMAAYAQQSAAAKAQKQYQEKVYEATKEAAANNAARQYQALWTRAKQEEAQAAQSIEQTARRAEAAAGTARTTAGETGTGGTSISALLNEYKQQELQFQGNVIRNKMWSDAQTMLNAEGVRANQQAQAMSALPKPVEKPNFATAMLRSASDVASTTATGMQLDAATGGTGAPWWQQLGSQT